MTTSNPNASGFLPTNLTFSEDTDQRLQQHTKLAADSARNINLREIALYDLSEVQTGQQWFNAASKEIKRYGFRKTFPFSDASLIFNHGIVGITLCTYIGGAFTDGTLFYPLPYVSTAIANQVGIVVSATQVIVFKGGTAPAITSGVINLEYLKQ